MKDRKKPEKFLPPHGMPSDGCEFAFSSRVPPKALTIKIPYTSWNYQYTIALRAVDLLAAEFDMDTAALTRSARNRDPGEKYLRHARMRTKFRFAVTVAVAEQPEIEI